MKSILKFTGLSLWAVLLVFALSSCNSDDEVVIDPGTGIPVADGFYMASTSADPTTNDGLVAETVEDDGFGSQTRNGFLANYLYVEGGSYNIVQIVDKEITKTFGGTASTETDEGSGCDFNDYTVATLTDGGAALSVGAGFYKVSFDQIRSELVLIKIEQAGVIGSATPGGWGSDTPLMGTSSVTGASFSATEVEMRKGEYKLRFNCRWNLDRRDDNTMWDEANGYQLFTNFGGAADNLLTGNDGANIQVLEADEGIYTVAADWAPGDGWSVNLTKTGDVAPITFVPDEHQWALTGDATPNGWADDDATNDPIGVDHDFNYEGVDAGTYTWMLASIDLIPGGFKIRANDLWDENRGWNELTLTGDTGDFSDDGGNIRAATAATYKMVLTTSDDGETYTLDFEAL